MSWRGDYRRATQALMALGIASVIQSACVADGIVVSKIYDPYVQPLETEIEFRALLQEGSRLGNIRNVRLGVGRALTERLWTEIYLIGDKEAGGSLSLDGYEAELKWQLSEQGEYAVDWGFLVELEREKEDNQWELETGLIAVREWNNWVGTGNFKLIYEWGSRVRDEFETAVHMQARYRYTEKFEPAIELHLGQDTVALGPAATGLLRLGAGKKLRWQLGLYPGLSSSSPDLSALALLEYEF